MNLGKINIVPLLVVSLFAALVLYTPLVASSSVAAGIFPFGTQELDRQPVLLIAKKAGRKARSSKTSATVIEDVRMKAYEDYTRVVFDLQRAVTFTQTRRKNPDRVIIELKDATLGNNAKAKLEEKEFPGEVTVTQPRSRTVQVSLNLQHLSHYKLLPLTDPPRLVFDVFKETSGDGRLDRAQGTPGANGAAPGIVTVPRAFRPTIKTIVIDPGHGGKDPGAVGRRGTLEKRITLKVGLYLRDLIKKRLGKKVLMTRGRDVFVELEDRANFANKHDADLFISIHVNAHPKRRVKGLELYHFGEASDQRAMEVAARENGFAFDPKRVGVQYILADKLTDKMVEDSLELAWTTKGAMLTHLDGRYKIVDHGVKTAPFYVLRFTTMPSILAEIGYISNSAEERRLRTKAYQRHIAEGIYKGIKAYVDAVEHTR